MTDSWIFTVLQYADTIIAKGGEKMRPIISGYEIRTGEKLGLQVYYGSNPGYSFVISENARGMVKVREVVITDSDVKESFYMAQFQDSDHSIFLRRNAKGSEILREMQLGGIILKNEVPHSILEKAVEKFFLLEMEKCTEKISISALAGWSGTKYHDGDSMIFLKNIPIRGDFPVLKKTLPTGRQEDMAYFLEKLRLMITDRRGRFLVLVNVFKGVLASVLHGLEMEVQNLLYIVTGKRSSARHWCEMCQTFGENENPVALDLALPQKKFEKILGTFHDECIVMTAFDTSDQYEKKKIRGNLMALEGFINGEKALPHPFSRYLNATAIVVCDFLPKTYAHCVLADLPADLNVNRWIGSVLKLFISYMEHNFESAKGLLKNRFLKYSKCFKPEDATDFAMWELLTYFFKAYGIELKSCLDIDKDKSAFANELGKEPFSRDFTEELRRVIYINAKTVPFVENRKIPSTKAEDSCYYDNQYIWIPVRLLRYWLNNFRMLSCIKECLVQLKVDNVLKTDKNGYSRRKVVNGEEIECYQFNREFFTKEGEIDIVDMGKDVKNAYR